MSIKDFFFGDDDDKKKKKTSTTPKVKTIKGTSGNDTLTSTSSAEKIYLYAGEDTVNFKSTHGKDTLYIGEGAKKLSFTNKLSDIKVQRKGNDIILKTKNSKNQTETVTVKNYLRGSADVTITGANEESKNLIEYLNDKTFTLGDSKLKTEQTINGSRLDNEIFKGGKGKDKISVFGGSGNIIIAGKGNDKIDLGNSYENIIKIKKGDGKDTVIFNNNVEADNVATIYAPDAEEVLYFKENNDLIIKFNHKKLAKEKKAVSESVTLKNAFDSDGELSEKLYISFDQGETEEKITDIMYLNLNTNAKSDNNIEGTRYNDRIYCGSKNNKITDMYGDNVIITNSSGRVDAATGDGDDFFYVKSLNTVTTINDSGGDNEICIEADNFSDVFTVFDVLPTNYENTISKKVAILSGKNFDNFNFSDFENNSLKGVTIKEFSDDYSLALINSKQGVSKTVEGFDIASHFIGDSVMAYLDNYNKTGYSGTAFQFLADSNVSSENKKELLNLYKTLSVFDDKGLVVDENDSNNHKAKTITMGPNDTITLQGKFQDTAITNDKKHADWTKPIPISDNKIVVSDYSITGSSASLEFFPSCIIKNNINNEPVISDVYNSLIFYGFDKNNKNSYTDYHRLDIINKSDIKSTYNSNVPIPPEFYYYDDRLFLQDKDRLYRIESYYSDVATVFDDETGSSSVKYIGENNVNYIISRDNDNHIAHFSAEDNYITLAKTYNIINLYSETFSYIDYMGGWADITSVNDESDDLYNVWDFDAKSSVKINDAGSLETIKTDDITEYHGDSLYIGSKLKDLRLFFNVKRDGANLREATVSSGEGSMFYTQNYDTDDLFIIHKNNMTAKNIKFEKAFENSSLYSSRTGNPINNNNLGFYNADININYGITIENMFGDGQIESFISDTLFFDATNEMYDNEFDLTYWANDVKNNVASWLNSHTKYIDTIDVLENGSKADINSLIAVYNNADYSAVHI